jgi:hypothetical protein
MPGAGELAEALARLSDGPVLAAPHGARLDLADGTLRPRGVGLGAQPLEGAFWLYMHGVPASTWDSPLAAKSWRRPGQGRSEGAPVTPPPVAVEESVPSIL